MREVRPSQWRLAPKTGEGKGGRLGRSGQARSSTAVLTGLVAGLVRWSEDPPPSITSAFSRNSERGEGTEGYC